MAIIPIPSPGAVIVPLVAKKAFAAIVITLCLGLQIYALVSLSGKRWWPFVDYRMFSQSYSEGATFRAWELRGRACVITGQKCFRAEPPSADPALRPMSRSAPSVNMLVARGLPAPPIYFSSPGAGSTTT